MTSKSKQRGWGRPNGQADTWGLFPQLTLTLGPWNSRIRSRDHLRDTSWPHWRAEHPGEEAPGPALELRGKEAESTTLHGCPTLAELLNLLSANFTSFIHFIDQTNRAGSAPYFRLWSQVKLSVHFPSPWLCVLGQLNNLSVSVFSSVAER